MAGSTTPLIDWDLSAMASACAADRLYGFEPKLQAAAFNPKRTRITTGVKRPITRRFLVYQEKLSCKSKSPGQGKTNGMPWDGTSSIKISTHVETVPARKPEKGLEALIVRLWAIPMPGERNAALWALADELRPYSAEVAEDVRMLCGMIWQGIGS